MNRRDWLKRAIIGAAALAVDPEQLLWTPKKTFFIPDTVKVATPKPQYIWQLHYMTLDGPDKGQWKPPLIELLRISSGLEELAAQMQIVPQEPGSSRARMALWEFTN